MGYQNDLFLAQQERDSAIKAVDENADDRWKEIALEAVASLAIQQGEFTADDVWFALEKVPDLPKVHDPRALGGVMMRAHRNKIINPTDKFVPSVRRHATAMRVWMRT